MTDFISRDNLKSLLANKMAAFNWAMEKIQRAETESIFAMMSQKTAEYRMIQFLGMIDEFESKKSYSQLINQFIADIQISAAISQVQNFEAKIAKLKNISSEYKAQARDEAFKLLDVGIDMMQDNIKNIDSQIANCKDPTQLAVLNKEKAQATQNLQEAKRIKKIEDPDEAMKELYKFSQDRYKEFLKKTTDLTDEQIDAKLATTKPESDDVFGYFKATQGVWNLFKDGMQDVSKNLEAKKEQVGTLNSQYSDLEKQKQDLIAQKEAIDKKQTEIKQTETLFDTGKIIAAGLSPALAPLASVGLSLAEKYVLADDKEQLSQSQQQYQESQQKFETSETDLNKKLNAITNTEGKVDTKESTGEKANSTDLQQKIESIETQQQTIKQTTASIEAQQQQLSNVAERIDSINNSEEYQDLNQQIENTAGTISHLQENNHQVISRMHHLEHQQSIEAQNATTEIKNAVKDGYGNTIKSIQDSKQKASQSILSESLTVDQLTNQINDVKNQLRESDELSELKKNEVNKEARQIKDQAIKSQSGDLISTISQFIKTNASENAKVVIDKSLSDLYSDLSMNFGSDRVVVDKRNGDRRSGNERRLETSKTTSDQKDNNNFFDRKDVAGRRNGDRRQSDHIFISQETINNLNFQS